MTLYDIIRYYMILCDVMLYYVLRCTHDSAPLNSMPGTLPNSVTAPMSLATSPMEILHTTSPI